MTAKELIKELWAVLKQRGGKDVIVCFQTGLAIGDYHAIVMTDYIKDKDKHESGLISLMSRECCEALDQYGKGLSPAPDKGVSLN